MHEVLIVLQSFVNYCYSNKGQAVNRHFLKRNLILVISSISSAKSPESAVGTATTNSGGLSGLSGRVSLVGRLLGSGKIGQCGLRLVCQLLGVVSGVTRFIATVMGRSERSRLGSLKIKRGFN
jgi:hypothetical protein